MLKKPRIDSLENDDSDSEQKQENQMHNKKQKKNKEAFEDQDELFYSDINKNKRLSMLIIAIIIVLAITVILHENLIIKFSISKFDASPGSKNLGIEKSEQLDEFQIQINKKQDNLQLRNSQVKQDQSGNIKNSVVDASQLPANKSPMQTYASRVLLDDFTTDRVYKQASQQMKDIFDEMIARPQQMVNRNRPNMIFIPSQKAHFAYSLYLHPQNQRYAKAQYYYYDQKYKIGSYKQQISVCIVAPGRNIAKGGQYRKFIDSINRQNYSNYKLVYVDDASDDGSAEQLKDYVRETDGPLNKDGRLQIIKNVERVYALANRNNAIRNYCENDSVVADVDADDAFIGRQVFKLVNAIYQHSQVWQFNSVFIYVDRDHQQVTTGPQEGVPMQLLEQNRYRGSLIWKTSQLRTFKAKLFKKINQSDFKDQKGQFYKWASDVFTQVPLVQLAGPKHYKHLFQIMYFYNWEFDKTTVYKRRHYRDIAWMQTPYKPLQSLQDEAVKQQNYRVNDYMKQQYKKNIKQAQIQAKRYNRVDTF